MCGSPRHPVSLSNSSSLSDEWNRFGHGLLGSVVGPAQVQVRTTSVNPVQATFTLTVSSVSGPPTQPSRLRPPHPSGDNQSGPPDQACRRRSRREWRSSGRPVANIAVNWETSQGGVVDRRHPRPCQWNRSASVTRLQPGRLKWCSNHGRVPDSFRNDWWRRASNSLQPDCRRTSQAGYL